MSPRFVYVLQVYVPFELTSVRGLWHDRELTTSQRKARQMLRKLRSSVQVAWPALTVGTAASRLARRVPRVAVRVLVYRKTGRVIQ